MHSTAQNSETLSLSNSNGDNCVVFRMRGKSKSIVNNHRFTVGLAFPSQNNGFKTLETTWSVSHIYIATLFFSPRLGHIWVMKEYGVAESWTKKKCIPIVGVASIFGCIINGKLGIHKCSYRQVKWSFGLCFQNLSFDLVECIVLLDGGSY